MIDKVKSNSAIQKQNDPERFRVMKNKANRKVRLRRYGITEEEWQQLFQQQNEKCAICYVTESSGRGWHTDHSHHTGKVRGILCYHCNVMLGLSKDNTDTLKKAIAYLENNIG